MEDTAGLMQLFSSVEPIASPVLTLLLDVPWAALAQAGWPFFGLLSQLNHRKINSPEAIKMEAVDGMGDPSTYQFFHDLQVALGRDGATLEAVAQSFLQKE